MRSPDPTISVIATALTQCVRRTTQWWRSGWGARSASGSGGGSGAAADGVVIGRPRLGWRNGQRATARVSRGLDRGRALQLQLGDRDLAHAELLHLPGDGGRELV